jgi:hypothetical protein
MALQDKTFSSQGFEVVAAVAKLSFPDDETKFEDLAPEKFSSFMSCLSP